MDSNAFHPSPGNDAGERESEQSWKHLLVYGKCRGLVEAPKLATGDGAMGFWKAIKQVPPPGTSAAGCTRR